MMDDLSRQDAPIVHSSQNERPVGEIVSDLWHNTEKLVRQEMQLGLAEIDERVDRLKAELIMKAIGGVVLHAGFFAIMASVILLLSKAVDPWISALIVGFVLCAVGYVLEKRSVADKVAGDATSQGSFTRKVMDQGHSLKEAMK